MNTPQPFRSLPSYSDPRSALLGALPALRPAEQISVTAAAEKYMRVNVAGQWQPFRRDVTPYMVEPTDMIASRAYRGLAFCGPSQSGKTQMLGSACAYTIMSDPGRVALFQMTRDAAAEYERNKLSPMVRNSPSIRERMAKGRGANNMFQKLYVGGTMLTIDWPTITKLSSATMRLVLGTDFDHFPESVDGEGDAYTMMRARVRTYMSRGMVVVESSPAAPLIDETWKPKTPHDCPPVRYGVLALYPSGTRGRWYWPCPHCEEKFEPTFTRLRYPDSLDPAEAGEAAEMACPHCGGLFGHQLKRELNGAGEWLHETAEGTLARIDSGRVRRTDLLSYWLDGAAAAFSTWAELVAQDRQAQIRFETTGDEQALKTAMNTGRAQPYFPRSSSAENELTIQKIDQKADGNSAQKGIAPEWVRYITISVDTQGTYFSVGVTGWGADGRHEPIDRFDLTLPPDAIVGEDGRALKPFDIAEDWAVLEPLAHRIWPVEESDFGLKAAAIAIDMHGGGATTENAYRFYRGRRKAGEGRRWYLTRGSGGLQHSDRVWLKAPERASGGAKRRKAATDIEILNMAVDRLKDAVAASLRLEDIGQNYCGVPMWMDAAQRLEFTAERRGPKNWEKRAGMVRNESFDHLVQGRALHIQLRGEQIDWAKPPYWALLSEMNPHAALLARSEPVENESESLASPKTKTHSAAQKSSWIKKQEGWI